jgi:hypothetical protein
MGRHKNPRYNRKRLIAAGTAAVTLLGVMVGIGIYGSALADQAAPAAASAECLPDPNNPTATAPPATTTEAPPSETAPSETAPTETAPTETAPTESAPTETAPTETAPTESAPVDTGTAPTETAPAETMPMGLAGDRVLNLGGGQPTGSAVPGEQGPTPADQPPAPPAGATEKRYNAPDCTDQLGPFPGDFINIRRVRPSNADARQGRGASTGTFVSSCGRNENSHNNPANFIVAPGNANGAHHLHDYVGNVSTDGNTTNESLAAAGTTCRQNDKSTYYWPVIRVRSRGSGADETNPHNVGAVQRPASVTLQFRGNARGKVVAAPEFLRLVTGDAKAATNGPAAANAKWGCTGFANRFTTKYPLCPRGSQLSRTLDFPSCWDGVNTDSANHRTHVLFPDSGGACPAGTKAIPQLRMTLTYRVPQGKVFAVDAFPEQLHNPVTDHGDFANVMPAALMDRAVNCINTGRRC